MTSFPHSGRTRCCASSARFRPASPAAFASSRRGCYYQVETLVFGRAVERATKPERFIVGCADPARPLTRSLRDAARCVRLPDPADALRKRRTRQDRHQLLPRRSVSVANTLAELSERIGADWHEIAPALRLDRRIGPYSYLAPGLGIAGGNLERDLATVLRFSEATGSEASVIAAFVKNSRIRRDWVLRLLHREVSAQKREPHPCNPGLSYKENTHSTKNSPSLALIEHLQAWPIRVYDPVGAGDAVPNHPTITASHGARGGARRDALLIMTPWPEFRTLAPTELASVMSGRTIIDPFRVLEPTAVRAAGLSYFTLGAPSLEAMGNS